MKKENYLKKLPTFQVLTDLVFKRAGCMFIFVMIFPLLSFSQENKVEETYLDYFTLPRESLFLHTNKTTYLVGENIWFKVYAYDRKNENTSKATTNIHLGLYDHTGKQIDKQLILTQNGFGSGNIELNKTLESGDYYMKISTNWMKNFEENDAFVQKISIINPDKEASKTKLVSQREYDVQFLPEGGHMVSNIRNVIGVKAIDDKGKGIKASGIIVNSKGLELTSFTTNHLGLGKFSFIPKDKEQYSATIVLENSKEIVQELPVNDGNGIAIYVNNLRDDKTVVSINTNKQSFERLKEQQFKLLLHKDGKVKTSNVILNSTSEIVSIDRKDLFKGVNILTLFNENDQPLVERMFFNAIDLDTYNLSVEAGKIEGDSIYYSFIPKMDSKDQVLNVSVSVLPTGTKSYDPSHNIISAIHLKPYLKGAIENPRYYFSNNNAKTAYELDVLLLTQGWSRYSWDNIFNKTPNPNFDFEQGITVNGHLNMNLSGEESLLLYPTVNNDATFLNLDDKGNFYVKNFFPIKDEEIKLSLINEHGKAVKPKLFMRFSNMIGEDVINTKDFSEFESFYKNKSDIPDAFLSKNRETLDEIVLTANLEKAQRKKYRLPFRGKLVNIGKEEVKKYNDLGDFLNNYGFTVEYDPLILGGRTIRSRRLRQGGDASPPIFYIDNIIVPSFTMLNRSISDFEDVYVDTSPNSSIRGDGFVTIIKAFSRRTPISRIDRSKSYQSFTKVDYGFEPVKKFYTPKYIAYNIKPFQEYGVIHWEPNVTIMSNRLTPIKMIYTGLEEVDLYIEGVSSDGTVFSQKITLDNSTKN